MSAHRHRHRHRHRRRIGEPIARLLEGLNERQREAATYDGDTLLILAGAGTGKTTTLCARAVWLLVAGVAPERILLVTFTGAPRASWSGARAASPAARCPAAGRAILGGTFHSLAHRFVRLHAGALGLDPGFSRARPRRRRRPARHAARGARPRRRARGAFPARSTMLDIYSRVVNAQRPLRETLSESFPWCEGHAGALAELFGAYAARKRERGCSTSTTCCSAGGR